MAGLTDKERETLLKAAQTIRYYKRMQAKGYEKLIKKAKDERTRQLLVERLDIDREPTIQPFFLSTCNNLSCCDFNCNPSIRETESQL